MRLVAFTSGSVSVMRGTSGAIPGVSTPTTRRVRSPSASSLGNSEQMCASGPSPSSIRSNASGPLSSSSRSYSSAPSWGPSSPFMRCTVTPPTFEKSARSTIA